MEASENATVVFPNPENAQLSITDRQRVPGDAFSMSQNGARYAKAAIPATMTGAGYSFDVQPGDTLRVGPDNRGPIW